MNLILASASPRRKEILNNLNINFTVMAADINETVLGNFSTEINAMNLSYSKGFFVYEKIGTDQDFLIIAADTMVDIDGEILGKPSNAEDAKNMIRKLSGRKHKVITGYALLGERIRYVNYEKTDVWFKKLSENEIMEYISTCEPYDKAGGYGIQGLGSLLVEKISGDYSNVVGLPISKIYDVLYNKYSIKLI